MYLLTQDLSAEAAARGEVRKVLIIDARSYAAAVSAGLVVVGWVDYGLSIVDLINF